MVNENFFKEQRLIMQSILMEYLLFDKFCQNLKGNFNNMMSDTSKQCENRGEETLWKEMQ